MRCPQSAGRKRSAGFSPLRLTTKSAVKSAQSCDRALKRAEARAPAALEAREAFGLRQSSGAFIIAEAPPNPVAEQLRRGTAFLLRFIAGTTCSLELLTPNASLYFSAYGVAQPFQAAGPQGFPASVGPPSKLAGVAAAGAATRPLESRRQPFSGCHCFRFYDTTFNGSNGPDTRFFDFFQKKAGSARCCLCE